MAELQNRISARISPAEHLTVLSREEIQKLALSQDNHQHELLRQCALAVLNSGSNLDDAAALLEMHQDFEVRVIEQNRGIKLELENAPASAFVDGEIIQGIQELLFAVVRDIAYVAEEVLGNPRFDLESSSGISNAVFEIIRNAGLLIPESDPNMIVCWGGHSISREEYDYTKEVGYELGLRGMDICTGCGPGAMKGPMKGATIAHAKQRIKNGRYVGISEPGIIAAESPNPIVNQLVVMPDIEKRLEAFVRLGHGIIIFPGGVGTCEELLFLLGVLLHPENIQLPFPLVLTGPESARPYFEKIDAFVKKVLGPEPASLYKIIMDDPVAVAREMRAGMEQVRDYRVQVKDAFYYNWSLEIDKGFQQPFLPTHENMASQKLYPDMPVHEKAANLRRVFSGIVAGNVKAFGLKQVREKGLYIIDGDSEIMAALDDLLQDFVVQHRMKLPGTAYVPCYKVETGK